MKKLLTLLLTLVLAIACLSGCKINKDGEVSVLWSNAEDSYVFTLLDSMDRSMYIKNMEYSHYDAQNNADTQMSQLTQVLNDGCSAVIINLVDNGKVKDVIDAVKVKDIPVVFLACGLSASDVADYQKAYVVDPYETEKEEYTAMLDAYLAGNKGKNFDKLDRNDDNKITVYNAYGNSYPIDTLSAEGRNPRYEFVVVDTPAYDGSVELFLTGSDEDAVQILLSLRANGFNSDKLETMLVGIFTIGIDANAGAVIDDGKDRTGKELEEYQEKLNAYSVMSAIDAGFIQGAVLIDDDGLTGVVCDILANGFKGKDALSTEYDSNVVVNSSDRVVYVKYATYGV